MSMPKVSSRYRKELDQVKNLLAKIGFPNKQNTDLTAWAILALQDDNPYETKAGFDSLKNGASIRDILDFCRSKGTKYAENTRESLRKMSIKYLVDAGIVIRNQDDPGRPTNSAKTNYILDSSFLKLVRKKSQKKEIELWRKKITNKPKNNSNWRTDKSLEVSFDKKIFNIHPSPHNFLSKFAVENFLKKESRNIKILYFSDTDDKSLYVDADLENFLYGGFDVHKQIPDVVAHDPQNKTLYLIECVASAGEINRLRKKEIDKLFPSSKGYSKRYISLFLDRKGFRKFSDTLAIGTEACVVEDTPHLIKFCHLKCN